MCPENSKARYRFSRIRCRNLYLNYFPCLVRSIKTNWFYHSLCNHKINHNMFMILLSRALHIAIIYIANYLLVYQMNTYLLVINVTNLKGVKQKAFQCWLSQGNETWYGPHLTCTKNHLPLFHVRIKLKKESSASSSFLTRGSTNTFILLCSLSHLQKMPQRRYKYIQLYSSTWQLNSQRIDYNKKFCNIMHNSR